MSCPSFEHLIVLPRLRVQNANAVSSPLTHGFPPMTAFLGFMWALERRVREAGLDLHFKAVGVVSHQHQELVTDDSFVKSLRLTRNPIKKNGVPDAIVEEGRIHLELSLLLAVHSERWLREGDVQAGGARESDLRTIMEIVDGMRIAGGSVVPPTEARRWKHQPWCVDMTGTDEDQQHAFRKTRMRLLPGYALVSRDDKLDARLNELREKNSAATPLEAWLSLARVNWEFQVPEGKEEGAWQNDRKKGRGWLVPIPVGYGALSDVYPAGSVPNARDATTPFRFVESLYSVGQWISPHRVQSARQLLWYADSQPERGLYRCRNEHMSTPGALEDLFDRD